MTKLVRSIVFLFTVGEIKEHLLNLEKNIFDLFILCEEWIVALKNGFSEIRYHENLLEETIHITSATQIFQPNIPT